MRIRSDSWISRIGVAAASMAGAVALSHALSPGLRPTPFILGFTAVILSTWLGGRHAGFLSVLLGVIGFAWIRPSLPSGDIWRLLAGFVAVSSTFGWLVARRYEIEAALRASESHTARSERRLQTMLDAQPACVKLVSADGLLLEMNRAGLEMIGAATFAQVARLPVADIIHPDDRRQFQQLHDAALAGQPGRAEFRIVGLTGDERWVDSHLVPFDASTAGRSTERAVLSVTHDVTERRRLEDQLRQSQKMEAIGLLAGGIAHDFNNLLTAISGYTDLVLLSLDKDDHRRREDLLEVAKAAKRATGLTRRLLAVSRRQILQPAVIDLNEMVADVQKLLRRTIPENIDLTLQLSDALDRVRADRGQLEQVLLNLAINAGDAMPRGGRLLLATDNVEVSPEWALRHPPMPPGRYVRLTVNDTGIGMSARTQARLFEPFFTTKERGKGTGLGLATAYGTVKQSDGFIWVDSEVGRGTTFEVYLPAVDAPVTAPAAAADTTSGAGSQTILLAEDDDAVRRLTRNILSSRGYQVIVARDGDEALDIAGRHTGPIHLLLTDMVMPGLNGRELAERLCGWRPDIRVLYMSGYTENVLNRAGFEKSLDLLQKPFLPADLLRRVNDALEPAS